MSAPKLIPSGTKGFDANETIYPKSAVAFGRAGYRFAIRYVRRAQARSNDLSKTEIGTLHMSGLAVMAVQHVESESAWHPTEELGRTYGAAAADAASALGLQSTTVWCDLEGVAKATKREEVIAYCNRWWDAVASVGCLPGLYVGWHAGLSGADLYRTLRFEHYWAAFNLNTDLLPIIRGVQMHQHVAKPEDKPAGVTVAIDTDVVTPDTKGGLPVALAPDEWDVK